MYKHLLVPLDGSELAEAALQAAAFFVETLGAKVTLLHIIERDAPEEIHGERHLSEPEEARCYLAEAALRAFRPETKIGHQIGTEESGGVAGGIQQYALSAGVDLIVMCTHGRGGLRHMLAGSNVQQVAACGLIPVLQVRPAVAGAGPFACRRLLVPLDGTLEHEGILEAAASLAGACRGSIRLLTVVPTVESLQGEHAAAARLMPQAAAALLDMTTHDAETYLQQQALPLAEAGLDVSSGIERGDPAEVILRVAERLTIDLIVLSTHRKVGAGAFWSGSVAPKVSNRSRVPVLLVPLQKVSNQD